MIRKIIVLLGLALAALAAEPEQFAWRAPVEGDLPADAPARIDLNAEVIRHTRPGFVDLRIFDDEGTETPYVIHSRRKWHVKGESFAYEVVDYGLEDGVETLVLKRPDEVTGVIDEVVIDTGARDFRRAVEVAASDDRERWTVIASDMVFDFTSRVNLRRTVLPVEPSSARFLRLKLHGAVEQPGTETINLQYKDLKLDIASLEAGVFRVNAVRGIIQRHKVEAITQRLRFDGVDRHTDSDGNTVLEPGRVNLPVERLVLEVETPFFYRRVEVQVKGQEGEDWRVAYSGWIYRIPGMPMAHLHLEPELDRALFLRLVIVNDDNPPLRIDAVKVEWLRRELLFIAEAGRHYSLYVGGHAVQSPRYETAWLLPYTAPSIERFPLVTAGRIVDNAGYRPELNFEWKGWMFGVVVVAVMILLAIWMYSVLRQERKVKGREGEAEEG